MLSLSLFCLPLKPHLAADNLELIRDDDGNNLLHIAASHGHADCLQHLTSLMGEDGLTERSNQQLTPAGLGVKVERESERERESDTASEFTSTECTSALAT